MSYCAMSYGTLGRHSEIDGVILAVTALVRFRFEGVNDSGLGALT